MLGLQSTSNLSNKFPPQSALKPFSIKAHKCKQRMNEVLLNSTPLSPLVMEGRRGSLHVSFGDHQGTLFDELERLNFEIQLNRAILQRSFSEPSPARFSRPVRPTPAPVEKPVSQKARWRLSWLAKALRSLLRPAIGSWRCSMKGDQQASKAFSKSCRA